MADKEDREDAVYKVDTVPPPDGDDDAYSAPTKIGPMASAVVNELIMAKTAEAAAASQAKPRVGGGDKEEALDENDIEAELAFPPPPKVPGAPASTPKVAAPASGSTKAAAPAPEKKSASAQVTTVKPPAPKPAEASSPQGAPPTKLVAGAVAVLVVLGILWMLLRH